MAKQPLNGVLQHIRKMAAVQTYREFSDCDLLERFVAARDEAAFTALIDRHGPMVLGVCRRALPNFHDAEDACQATFLVLARTAASVRKKTSLSSWLHGVAFRVAAKLKRGHARRKSREYGADAPAPRDPAAEVSWREVQAILDEELQRLPERYRAPVILCYLECMTRDEAAKQLGLLPTTLYGRLERARDMLRTCLTKRGLTLSAAISAAAVGEGAVQAALAPTFVVSSTKAAMLLAAGQAITDGVVASNVVGLTEGVLKTMLFTKLKTATAVLLVFAALCGGIGLMCQTQAGETPKDQPAAKKRAEDGKNEVPKTDKERLQGKWQLVKQVWNGEEAKLDDAELELLVIGDSMRLRNVTKYKLDPTRPDLSTSYARYRLDASSKPKCIDEVGGVVEELFDLAELDKKFDNAEERYLGIYSFDGDTLNICYCDKGMKKRPAAFESREGSDIMLQVFKRVPAK
jgi:RNA polymerase sigma factor (sigma-70 family)